MPLERELALEEVAPSHVVWVFVGSVDEVVEFRCSRIFSGKWEFMLWFTAGYPVFDAFVKEGGHGGRGVASSGRGGYGNRKWL